MNARTPVVPQLRVTGAVDKHPIIFVPVAQGASISAGHQECLQTGLDLLGSTLQPGVTVTRGASGSQDPFSTPLRCLSLPRKSLSPE
jgi:hypothetical protein